MAVDEAKEPTKVPKPPPNLRVAENDKEECDTCSHYARGRCTLYANLPVDDEWTCDSWDAGKAAAPKDLKGAETAARAWFQDRKAAPSKTG